MFPPTTSVVMPNGRNILGLPPRYLRAILKLSTVAAPLDTCVPLREPAEPLVALPLLPVLELTSSTTTDSSTPLVLSRGARWAAQAVATSAASALQAAMVGAVPV